MDPKRKEPFILRLSGVRLSDYVSPEDIADAKALEADEAGEAGLSGAGPGELSYDRIPAAFTGIESWPHSTDLRCWTCGFTFDGRPKFVPGHVREVDGALEFEVKGNMCSFQCAELWIEERLGGRASDRDRWAAQDNLRLLYFIFTGRRVSQIKPAIPVTELRSFGGALDDETFWAKMRALDPAAGGRDHAPAAVVPERERGPLALGDFRAARGLSAPLVAAAGSVWGVCGVPGSEPAVDARPAGPPPADAPLEPPAGPSPKPAASPSRPAAGAKAPPKAAPKAKAANEKKAPPAKAAPETKAAPSTEAAPEAKAAPEALPTPVATAAPDSVKFVPPPGLAVSDNDIDDLLADLC